MRSRIDIEVKIDSLKADKKVWDKITKRESKGGLEVKAFTEESLKLKAQIEILEWVLS